MRATLVVRSLLNILDGENVIYDIDDLRSYSRDAFDITRAVPPHFKIKTPVAVVRPETENDVVRIVKFANRKKIPLIPYGGGTGLMGGAASTRKCIVLDLKNLNGIEISENDMTAAVGAGVIIKHLDSELRKKGLMFAHDPWSAGYATVGGAISTNGVGYLAAKYGAMREQVVGMKAVTASGEVLDMKPVKPEGTDMKSLFIGSEGVLGIVTSATLKIHPVPESQRIVAFEFSSFADGYKAVARMLRAGVRPASLDLFEAYDVGADAQTLQWLQDEPGTRLYLVFDGTGEEVEAMSAKTNVILEGAKELDKSAGEDYWRGRYDIAERYIAFIRSSSRNTNIKFDFIHTSIPAGSVLEFDRLCAGIASKHGITVQGHGIWQAPEFYSMNFFAGSAGANNRMCRAMDEMLRHAAALGTMEYCHGTGARLAYLMKSTDGGRLRLLRTVKRALDPNNIMNPGKLGL